jgi:hypothetical protein
VANFNFQPVINILGELVRDNQLDIEQIDQAIDALESIKSTIDIEDDEAIDKVDELQDYLQYLLTVEEPSLQEIKEELADIISNLKK